MLTTTNYLMQYSIITMYALTHLNLFMLAGFLSYNIPQLFKLKTEKGYILRAGLMSLMSVAMLPIIIYAPEQYNLSWKIFGWALSFSTGLFGATYGARIFHAEFASLFSEFTVKSSIRQGCQTDIRYMDKEMPVIANYNPLKYINLDKGVFVGLDENVKPIYISDLENEWYKRHFLIVGATRSGKGVAMQTLGIQSLMLGETLIMIDPKKDKFLPNILKAQCDELNLPYNFIDLTNDTPQINLVAGFNQRDLKNCLVEAFSQREMGSESDVYRKNEQEFLALFAKYIVTQDSSAKSLAELCDEFGIARFTDKYKSSISDLNKLCDSGAINATSGISLTDLFNAGGCIYIVGDLQDETLKKIQRFIFCRFVQLARNHANYIDEHGGHEKHVTVFADELVAHISRFVAESYTVSLGWGLKIVSAIQDLKLLNGAPADLNIEFLIGAVFGNSQNKLFYRADDTTTADFLSDMTGQILVEEEQKIVTRNTLNSEKLDNQIRLIQSKRNLFDRNMIYNLKQFEAIFCSSLNNRKTIASLCKTSPIIAPQGVNGKKIVEITKTASNTNLTADKQDFLTSWHTDQLNHQKLIQEIKSTANTQNTQDNNGEINNEYSTNEQSNNNRTNSLEPIIKKTSTSKSDYLF